MEELHSLSIQLFELLAKYENVMREDRHFSEAKELRTKITEVEAKLKIHMEGLKGRQLAQS